MNDTIAVLCVISGGCLTAVSQVLLKFSAKKQVKSWISKYLNINVISSYAILLFVLLLNTYCMRFLAYKLLPVLSCSSYIFVILLSKLIFREALSKRKILGTLVIIFGIVTFSI